MKPAKIDRYYVVDSSIAIYGGFEARAFTQASQSVAIACASFLSRAAFHGAELHVPFIFFSEITNVLYSRLVGSGLYSLEEGKLFLEDIFSTNWELHFPVRNSVFDTQFKLGHQGSTTDAEFLALAEDLKYTFITTDQQLVQKARATNLKVKVLLVSDHPWAQLGGVDEFPIDL